MYVPAGPLKFTPWALIPDTTLGAPTVGKVWSTRKAELSSWGDSGFTNSLQDLVDLKACPLEPLGDKQGYEPGMLRRVSTLELQPAAVHASMCLQVCGASGLSVIHLDADSRPNQAHRHMEITVRLQVSLPGMEGQKGGVACPAQLA